MWLTEPFAPARANVASGLEIALTTGLGEGPTELAAFDRALFEAGIHNLNLIPLSSVIPPGARLVEKRPDIGDECWGQKLYLVIAQERASEPGTEAWAGIGWVQNPDTGAGLFVEHHGRNKDQVERQISQSLSSMTPYRSSSFGPIQMVVHGVACIERPACALVAATYCVESW